MSETTKFDLVIIGGGPGGYTAALRAAQLDAQVALVQGEGLGGTCLQWGCIPTKTWVKTAEMIERLGKAERMGLELSEWSVNMKGLVEHKDEVIAGLTEGIERLLKDAGVTVYRGWATIDESERVVVELLGEEEDGETIVLEAEHILLAVGSVTAQPPIPGADIDTLLTSKEILDLQEVPESLVVIGGGVIGMEFASIFNALGVQVTVLEMLPQILPPMDQELARRLGPIVRKKGINIITGATVKGIEGDVPREKKVIYEHRGRVQTLHAEKVLVATGRVPNTRSLPLDELGIEHKRGAITVDDTMQTSNPRFLAIGDCVARMMLAHVASAEALVAVENLFGDGRPPLKYEAVPHVVFTLPPASSVGLTEAQAKERDGAYGVAKFPFAALGKAVAMDETDGLVKIIFDEETQLVLGMHILGVGAPELIHEGALAIQHGLTVADLAETVHAHPTLSEAVMEAAHLAIGAPLHVAAR